MWNIEVRKSADVLVFRCAAGVECVVGCSICGWCERIRSVYSAQSTACDSQSSVTGLTHTASLWSALLVTLWLCGVLMTFPQDRIQQTLVSVPCYFVNCIVCSAFLVRVQVWLIAKLSKSFNLLVTLKWGRFCLSSRFTSCFWTFWPLTTIFCMSVGHTCTSGEWK